ncbi:MAG: TrmH family RNA methyltransferase [Peptidiphaga sp.]|jgi:23S rRNA methyltransferase
MQEIEAADAPQWKLSRVKDILRGGGRKAIVVDDEENIVDAIEYGVQIEEIYCSEGYRPEMEATAEILRPYETFRLAPATLARLFKAEKRSRIFAVAKAPRRRRLEDLRGADGDVVALDGVRLLGNIGAIARTATAFDAAGLVLLDSNLTSVFDRRLTRASRALNFALPIVLADRREFLAFAEDDARPVVLLDRGGACTLERSLSAPHPVALVMGSERTGASEEIEAAAAVRCEIPISGRVESLNVSVAAGIALYARSRARRG